MRGTDCALEDVLHTELKAGELDLTVNIPASVDADTASHPIFRDECVVVAPATHEVLRKRATLRGLTEYGWLHGARTLPRASGSSTPAPAAACPRPRSASRPPRAAAAGAHRDGLLSFMSRRHLEPRERLREVPLRETTMRREFALEYRKSSYLSPAAVRVIEELKSRARRLFQG